MSNLKLFHNPRVRRGMAYPPDLAAVLDAAGFAAARAEISRWPGYAPTPLVDLAGIAARLGLGAIRYKDESRRFGLKSFKALGGAYAVKRAVASAARPAALVTVTCATDGNHGRSVAWGARLCGCRCVIYIHATVSEGRAAAIAAYGAEVRRVAGNYDDAVRAAAAEAARSGWIVVSDTSYAGYVDIPRDVMHGYGVMAEEAAEQQSAMAPPTHMFVQAGVGALAAAVIAESWIRRGPARPRAIVVEPDKAACNYASAMAGKPTTLDGDLDTIMAGLSCGEVSLLAWTIVDAGADAFISIPDARAEQAVRLLAEFGVVGGETGAAGLAGLLAVCDDPAARAALGLDARARVLLFGSEGDTDPAIYASIVGRTAAEVQAGSAFMARR